jgi:hypothetical protein
MPLASLPGQISGRNRAWRRVIIDAMPTTHWQAANTTQPPSLRIAAQMITGRRQSGPAPEREPHARGDQRSTCVANFVHERANNVLYATCIGGL